MFMNLSKGTTKFNLARVTLFNQDWRNKYSILPGSPKPKTCG